MWQEVVHNLANRPALVLLAMSVVVVVSGLSAQILAFRLGVPSIILLLLTGVALGPDGLGLVQPELYRYGLRTIITGCVAIIVFESVLRIEVHELRRVSRPVLGLSTIGVATTTVLASVIAWKLLALPYEVALLFGAIVSITGPTVIMPIVRRLALPARLKTTLEGESVFADAVGVILAASIFSFISDDRMDAANGLALFIGHLALGAAIGAAIAYAGRRMLDRLSPLPGEYIRLGVLSTALVVYTAAELVTRHLGIMAVAVAAIVFGLKPLPYTETIKQFKGDLTLIALSLVFILLAANLPVRSLFTLGWQGVAVVVLLMVVVRPLCILVSTWGSELSWREKAFLAALGPRGIVAVSAATFFSLEFAELGLPGGEGLKALVFLVVIVTVTLEGGGAPWTARWLGVLPPKVVIFGGDKQVRRHAQALVAEGEAIQILDENIENVHQLLLRNLPAKLCRLGDLEPLASRCSPGEAKQVLIATPDHDRNLKLATFLRRRYPELPIQMKVGPDTEAGPLRDLGVEPWSPAWGEVPRADMALAPLAFEEVAEATVSNPSLAGSTIADLDLPAGSVLVALKRGNRLVVPRESTRLEVGDRVTIAGESHAVEQTRFLMEES